VTSSLKAGAKTIIYQQVTTIMFVFNELKMLYLWRTRIKPTTETSIGVVLKPAVKKTSANMANVNTEKMS
jgi:uncharacterized protein involved in tolerance to divalent cations